SWKGTVSSLPKPNATKPVAMTRSAPKFPPCLCSLACAGLTFVVAAAPLKGGARLESAIGEVIQAPEYKSAHWGILVIDLASGETCYELTADRLSAPASVTKLYSTAAALDALGAEYRFQTPVCRRGEVDATGDLKGDLILVASGDLSFGGRTTA